MNTTTKINSQLLIFNLLILCAGYASALSVTDDRGNAIDLAQPVNRIISLAPHTTELLFAAGAGDKIVGAVKYSYYPEAAKLIPRVGDTHNLDLEKIISLNPGLIVAWYSNAAADTELLKTLDIPVYISEPVTIEAIAKSIKDLGILSGTSDVAAQASDSFLARLDSLKNNYSGKPAVSTFYQFWNEPIYTINGDHIISQIIQLCGGNNIFADLSVLSAQVNLEAVIKANPDVIVASGADEKRPPWLDTWKKWPNLAAVKNDNLYFIPPDLIQRHTPRVLDGAEMMCDFLEKSRNK